MQNKFFNYLLKNTLLKREGKLSMQHLVHPSVYLQKILVCSVIPKIELQTDPYGRQRTHEKKQDKTEKS